MIKTRVIPCLSLKDAGFYKTTRFRKPIYLGDPINILKIFNEKEADEIVILDITATLEGKEPNFNLLSEMASECFMPLGYGGGITNLDQMSKLFGMGFEKICLNTAAIENARLVERAATKFGSQSIVVCLDVKKTAIKGYQMFTRSGEQATGVGPVDAAVEMERLGAGELIVNSIDRDGMMQGYDTKLLKQVSDAVNIPIVALGGAGNMDHFVAVAKVGGISAVGAGSMFVFQGPHRAVLINMPSGDELDKALATAD